MPFEREKRHTRTMGSSHEFSVAASALAGLCSNCRINSRLAYKQKQQVARLAGEYTFMHCTVGFCGGLRPSLVSCMFNV